MTMTTTTNDCGRTTEAGDALAFRARDVASAGLVVLPVVAHLYSIALLWRLDGEGLPISGRGRKARREAWRLSLAMLGIGALCGAIVAAVWLG